MLTEAQQKAFVRRVRETLWRCLHRINGLKAQLSIARVREAKQADLLRQLHEEVSIERRAFERVQEEQRAVIEALRNELTVQVRILLCVRVRVCV